MFGGSYFGQAYFGGIANVASAPASSDFFKTDTLTATETKTLVHFSITSDFASWSDWDFDLAKLSNPEIATWLESPVALHQNPQDDNPGADSGHWVESPAALHQNPQDDNPGADSGHWVEFPVATGLTPPVVNFPDADHWQVDGISLQTYAYNIVTWGGSRQEPPKLKGSNSPVPFRAGQKFNRKSVDSRIMSLAMWVLGSYTDGKIGDRKKFESNWRFLRRLLWTPDREVVLSKTFYDDISNSLITAQAKAQYVSGLAPDMNGTRRASFIVDLLLADPFFYDVVDKVYSLAPNIPVSVSSFGDYPTVRSTVKMIGPSFIPRVENLLTGVSVSYNGSIGAGQYVLMNVENFTAVFFNGASFANVVESVTHEGDFHWMRVGGVDAPVFNGPVGSLVYTSSNSTGSAVVTATPVWL